MEEYDLAIETFRRLLDISVDALKIDRAFFQTGESYFALAEYGQARSWYGKLVDKYDFSALSEKELQAMKTQRLRGLVKETTRELVAKAQIRIGDAYTNEKQVEAAIAAYSLVPTRYPQEDLLVQKSFDNMANMALEQQGVEMGIAVLQQGIEQVEDPYFRGRAQLKIAKILYVEERYQEAIEAYRIYEKAYGDRAAVIGVTLDQINFLVAEAYRELARIQDSLGPLAKAKQLYESIIEDYPESLHIAESYYGLGQAQYGLGEIVAASQTFAATVEKYPLFPVAPYALNWQARLIFASGDGATAIALYQRLIDEYPESVLVDQAWKDMGLVYKQSGNVDAAINAFSQVSQEASSWTKIQAEAGDMLLAAGRMDEIITRFNLQGAIKVATETDDHETLAELYYIKGRMARERQDHEGEIEHLSVALENSKNAQLNAYLLFFRGLAYYQQANRADASGDTSVGSGYFEASVEDLEKLLTTAVALDMRGVAYRTRGVGLTRLGRSAEAVSTYKILIDAAPTLTERIEFELMLMELYYDQGKLEETEAAAKALITSGDGAGERSYFVLVSLLLEQERYNEVLTVIDKALGQYPKTANRATLMSVRARSLFFLERYEEAVRAFNLFINAYPDHRDLPSTFYQLGYCYEILGQYERAAAAFGVVSGRFAADDLAAEALYHSGENLYNASKFKEALAAYLKLSEQYPQEEIVEKALYSASWTYMDMQQEQASIATMQDLVDTHASSNYARYAQFSIGDYYYSKKEFKRAKAAYEKVIEAYGGTEEAEKALILLGDLSEDLASRAYDEVFIEFDRGNYAYAVNGFEQVFAKYPTSYSALAALANKGVALEHLGDNVGARGSYQKVIEVAADNPDHVSIVEFVKLRLGNL